MKRVLLVSATLAAGVLVLAVLGEAPLASLLAALAVVLHLLRLLSALVRRRRPARRLAAARVGIWLLTVLGCAVAFAAHDRIARARGQSIVAACSAYRAQHAAWPPDLAALVPAFLAQVPRPSDMPLLRRPYRYRADASGFRLGYSAGGLVYREYDSTQQRWRTRD